MILHKTFILIYYLLTIMTDTSARAEHRDRTSKDEAHPALGRFHPNEGVARLIPVALMGPSI